MRKPDSVGHSRLSICGISHFYRNRDYPAMPDPDLVRFVNAQASVYQQVVDELTEGRKRTHWIWFIFPQLAGLGHSPTAQRYAIQDLDQAKRYLADPILGSRLRQDVRLLIGHKDKSAFEIFGSPDDFKLRSCLTLFAEAASNSPDRCSSWRCINSMTAQTPEPCGR